MHRWLGELFLDLIDHEDVPIGPLEERDRVCTIDTASEVYRDSPLSGIIDIDRVDLLVGLQLVDYVRGKLDTDLDIAEYLPKLLLPHPRNGFPGRVLR